MDSYNEILLHIQQTESTLLERWKEEDSSPTKNPKMEAETEKMYLRYLRTLQDLCKREDASKLFLVLIPQMKLTIENSIIASLMKLSESEKIINLVIDYDGTANIFDAEVSKILDFQDPKPTMLKFFQTDGKIISNEVCDKIFDTGDEEIIRTYLASSSASKTPKAFAWIAKQPDAIDLFTMLMNTAKSWFSFEEQKFLLKELCKKEKDELIPVLVKNMPEGKSLCSQAELLLFRIPNGKEIWKIYQQKAGNIQSLTLWMAKRKGWL